MARLSQPAHSLLATPAAGRVIGTVTGSTTAMSSHPLHTLSPEASLQSHGNDNRPHSPSHRGSEPSTFSPADCRALSKVLRDVGDSSPLLTPSRLEPSEQSCANTDRTSSTIDRVTVDEDYGLAGHEATDAGYEDEDDSMELSDGVENATGRDAVNMPGDHASQSVSNSNSNLWLQDSIPTHDDKDRLRYSECRALNAKYTKARRQEKERTKPAIPKERDTIEDIMNLPGKRAPPARPQDLGRNDSDFQPIPEEIKQLNLMRLSMEKVLDDERVEQERATHEQESGIFVSGHGVPHHRTTTTVQQQSIHEGSDADNEDNDATDDAAETKEVTDLQTAAPNLKTHINPAAASPRNRNGSILLVPSTPEPTAQAPDQNHIQLVANQNVLETPFTRTLSYFKQHKGAENSPSKRRRNTALQQEIAAVAGIATDAEDQPCSTEQTELRHVSLNTVYPSALPTTSAPADLEGIVLVQATEDTEEAQGNIARVDEPHQAHTSSQTAPEATSKKDGAIVHSEADDTQKQLIVYPQHPAFVNAIGMIPAAVFWMTAAPIIKYTTAAVDLLIDSLRDVYL
ncbi:uncharacterized protein EKO05_0001990 [Ascochyta rabiei]|uniref:uncharacterized protein n=1 Tax=Didymella rabiei TaxID=5454 RepID=UPI001900E1DF|nr:uncharacterized protein EKO05_0001990 [Ascochyta rabiei]UPX11384.1 hypothetical protein EKO05_0001990 [Ascochyta rabiei]